MKNQFKLITCVCLLLAANTAIFKVSATPKNGGLAGTETLTQTQASEIMKNSGNGFIKNAGQVFDNMGNSCPDVFYKLEFQGVDIFVTKEGLTYSFNKWEEDEKSDNPLETKIHTKHIADQVRTDWYLLNANISAESFVEEDKASDVYYNFYSGDLGDKATHLYKYQRLIAKNIYPGIDWVLYINKDKGLKYDFIVHPGANPDLIKIQVKGAETLALANENKTLVIENRLSNITDANLVAYQNVNGNNEIKKCTFSLVKNIASYNVGNYDNQKDLIIDPTILLPWATYYGGVNEDQFRSVDVSVANSCVAAVGYNLNGSFPSATFPSGTNNGSYDAVIAVFNLNGQLIWAGYIGSSKNDYAWDVAIDGTGNFVLVGESGNYSTPAIPTLPFANAGGYYQTTGASIEGWIARINSGGSISWCTLFGGNDQDLLNSVAIDPTNNGILVAGMSYSSNLPVQQQGTGYYQPTLYGGIYNQDIMLARFNSSTSKIWCTYFGSNGSDYLPSITTDASGFLYLTGICGATGFPLLSKTGAYNQSTYGGSFISVFSNLSNQQWCTFWTGVVGTCIDVDPTTKDVYMCGMTFGTGMATKTLGGTSYFQGTYGGGGKDGYVVCFSGGSWALKWSTFLGKTDDEWPRAITVSPQGGVIVVGDVQPVSVATPHAMGYLFASGGPYNDVTCNILTGITTISEQREGFISYFDPTKFLQWSTFYGVDGANEIFYDADIEGQYCFIDGIWQKDCAAPINNDHTVNPGGGAYYQANPGGVCNGTNWADYDGFIIKLYAPDPGYFKIGKSDETNNQFFTNDNQSITFNLSNSGKSTVKIIDVSGREIYNNSSSSSQPAINISAYPPGIYMLLFENNSGVITNKFFKN